jgi:hypothetical protein
MSTLTTKTSPPQLRLEYIAAGQLAENPSNWRTHPQGQVSAIRSVIDDPDVGWAGACLYNERTKRLIDGHARRSAVSPETLVPVLIGNWSEEAEKKILLTLDPLAAMATSNAKLLSDLIADVDLSSVDDSLSFFLGQLDAANQAPFAVVYVRTDSLKDHPRNYRKHPEDQLAHIVASIKAYGFVKNVIIGNGDTILAGHGVVQAAKKMGQINIPVIRLDLDAEDPRAMKIVASDNEIAKLAEVDDRALTEMLKEIMASDPVNLEGSGFNAEQLAALAFVTRPEGEIKDKNAANENVILGTGLVNFLQVFEALAAIQYKGAYTFETNRGKDPLRTAAYNIELVKYVFSFCCRL